MRMEFQFKGDQLARFRKALDELGGEKAKRAMARALNDVGRPAANKSLAATAKQSGVSKAVAIKRGGIQRLHASASKLQFVTLSQGGYTTLKDFNPVQSAKGVRASPWGRRHLFGGRSFMGAKPGAVALKLGGHVFLREGKDRLPIKNMSGPAIPKEMVKGEAAKTWQKYVDERLPKRVDHYIKQTTKGVFD